MLTLAHIHYPTYIVYLHCYTYILGCFASSKRLDSLIDILPLPSIEKVKSHSRIRSMDLSGELERIALNATDLTVDNADATSTDTIDRWQKLFNFTEEEARDHISSHRSNISRTRISDEHWQLVCDEKEGHDKELRSGICRRLKLVPKRLRASRDSMQILHLSHTFSSWRGSFTLLKKCKRPPQYLTCLE